MDNKIYNIYYNKASAARNAASQLYMMRDTEQYSKAVLYDTVLVIFELLSFIEGLIVAQANSQVNVTDPSEEQG